MSFRAALDNRGLLWSQNRPAHIEDVLAFMAMVEGLPLPFGSRQALDPWVQATGSVFSEGTPDTTPLTPAHPVCAAT